MNRMYNRNVKPVLAETWRIVGPGRKDRCLEARIVPTETFSGATEYYGHARYSNVQPVEMFVFRGQSFPTAAEAEADLGTRVMEKAFRFGYTMILR